MENKENRLEVLLYNAISMLIDETFQYEDSAEWFDRIQDELGCTAEELETYGIKITMDGEIYTI